MPECPGQLPLPLWARLHPCPVCETDRAALGHELTELAVPYTTEDLVAHLGSCAVEDRGIAFHDEVYGSYAEPF